MQRRTHRRIGLILASAAILVLGAGAAKSIVVTTELNQGLSDFASSATLTAGDTIALDVRVFNPALDSFDAMFASLVFDSTQLQYLGAVLFPILVEETCVGTECTTKSLMPIVGGGQLEKPNDPESLGTGSEAWVNSLVHTNPESAAGPGGEVANRLFFEVLTGLSSATFGMALTAGDIILDGNNAAFTGPLSLNGIVVTPEPGTAVLLGLGLLGLGRWPRARRPSESSLRARLPEPLRLRLF